MQLRGLVDCLIPRGGRSLIQSILDNATVPFVIDGDGNCHVYVDAAADLDMALDIIVNAKTQRPGVCNAAEKLLVHADVAEAFLPRAVAALDGVELVGDDALARRPARHRRSPPTTTGTPSSSTSSSACRRRRVPRRRHRAHRPARLRATPRPSSPPTSTAADRFAAEVDAAAVVVNASTRFVDGEEFGFGAEIGISTQKLHARGPMGLRQLTTEKFVVRGTGQTRG